VSDEERSTGREPDLTEWWQKTHDQDSSAEKMWDAWQQPHRSLIITALQVLDRPIESVYEIGCGSGPNLRYLRDKYPGALRLGGNEPVDAMRAWAAERLAINIDPEPFPMKPAGRWDVVFSCYALAYVTPPQLLAGLAAMHGATSTIILAEPSAEVAPYGPWGMYSIRGALPAWAHNYTAALKATGWLPTWRWPVIPHVDGLNTVLIAEEPK